MHDHMVRLYEVVKNSFSAVGQSAVARLINVSPQTLNNWEERGISSDGLLTIQKILNVNATWITDRIGSIFVGVSVPESRDSQSSMIENIKYLMNRDGLNPTSLAGAIKNRMPKEKWVPQATIFRIIEGESNTPRISSLQPIAEFFDIELKDLMFGNVISKKEEITKSKIHPDTQAVIKMMEGTDTRGKAKALIAVQDVLEMHQAHLRKINQ